MASFTPLEGPADLRNASVKGGRSQVPIGIVIDKSCRVYITRIPVERIEREGATTLKAELESFGPIESYRMFTDRSGRFIGSALCTYRNPADASMAVNNLNGQMIDGSPIGVTFARDHGVVLLHRVSSTEEGRSGSHRGFLDPSDVDGDDEKWHHDKYELLAQEKDMDEVLGIRPSRFGRGRRGYHGRGGRKSFSGESRIDAEFEKYIRERDGLLGVSRPSNDTGSVGGGASVPNDAPTSLPFQECTELPKPAEFAGDGTGILPPTPIADEITGPSAEAKELGL